MLRFLEALLELIAVPISEAVVLAGGIVGLARICAIFVLMLKSGHTVAKSAQAVKKFRVENCAHPSVYA